MKYLYLVFIIFAFNNSSFSQCVTPTTDSVFWGITNDFFAHHTVDNDTTNIDTVSISQNTDTSFTYQFIYPTYQHFSPISQPVTILSTRINTINDLPCGLNWTIDSLASNNNNTYYPQNYRYGSITFCGNTSENLDLYVPQIEFYTCGTLSGIQDCSTSLMPLYFKVKPTNSQISSLVTYSKPSNNCQSTLIDFTINMDSVYEPDWLWDFGNGDLDTGNNVSHYFAQTSAFSLTYNGYTYWDTIYIRNGIIDSLTNSSNNILCKNDSAILYISNPNWEVIEWYKDSVLIENYHNDSLLVTTSGNYYVHIEDGCYCFLNTNEIHFLIEEIEMPVIVENPLLHILKINNPNNYSVQWYSNGNILNGETNNSLDISTYISNDITCTFTSNNSCSSTSDPYFVCYKGSSSASNTSLSLDDNILFTATDFVLNNYNKVAWAISTLQEGPVTNINELQNAIQNNMVFESSSLNQFELSCADISLDNGDYLMTPFSSEVIQQPLYWNNNLQNGNCQANMVVSLLLNNNSNWIIHNFDIEFPNGDLLSNLALIPDFNPTSFPAFPSSIDLNDNLLYTGNPNGAWKLHFENTGTEVLKISIPPFFAKIKASNCTEINSDQYVFLDSLYLELAPNEAGFIEFLVPNEVTFVSIDEKCSVFGNATSFKSLCVVGVNDLLENNHLIISPNPSNGNLSVTFNLEQKDDIVYNIYDYSGKVIYEQKEEKQAGLISKTIDLKNKLSSSIYFLKVSSSTQIYFKKFIVE